MDKNKWPTYKELSEQIDVLNYEVEEMSDKLFNLEKEYELIEEGEIK